MLPLKHRTIWKKKIDDDEKNCLIVRIVKEQPAEKIAKSELSRQNSVISTDVSGIVFSASNQRYVRSGYASAASTSGKIRNIRSSREVSKIKRKVSCRPLRKNLPPYASTSCMARISAAIPALSM